MRWDLYCRVIDNFGDIGVCWRLAAQLGRRGESVRLWVDDARALQWMAPDGAPGVDVRTWPDDPDRAEPGDVIIEAFGCELPVSVIHALAARSRQPVWINLEYLSAESYVERSHGLTSPVLAGPGKGLVKWFYFPGFSAATGGLLREPGCVQATSSGSIDDHAPVSVFCYDNPMLHRLVSSWPHRLLLAPGPAQSIQSDRATPVPWVTQDAFDRRLAACAVNFVRGEDSFVRAMWAGRPFVWQIYPQQDGAHRAKLEAFLDRFLDGAVVDFAADLRHLWRAWNGFGDWPRNWPDMAVWTAACLRWRAALLAQDDLLTRLLRFVAEKR